MDQAELSKFCEEVLACAKRGENPRVERQTDDTAVYRELMAGNEEVIVEIVRVGDFAARKICRQKIIPIKPRACAVTRETMWALERVA